MNKIKSISISHANANINRSNHSNIKGKFKKQNFTNAPFNKQNKRKKNASAHVQNNF